MNRDTFGYQDKDILDVLVEALENIKKKKPELVSINEAADMAIEFQIEATKALQKYNLWCLEFEK